MHLPGGFHQTKMGIGSVLCKIFWFSFSFCQGVQSLWPPPFSGFLTQKNQTLVRPFRRELCKNQLDSWNLWKNYSNVSLYLCCDVIFRGQIWFGKWQENCENHGLGEAPWVYSSLSYIFLRRMTSTSSTKFMLFA